MKMIPFSSLDPQVQKLITRKNKEANAMILLFQEDEKYYMDIFLFNFKPTKVYKGQLISDHDNKDNICTGIMRWFRQHWINHPIGRK